MRYFSKTFRPPINLSTFFKKIDWLKLEESVLLRGLESNIKILHNLRRKLESTEEIRNELEEEFLKLPNYVHPRIVDYGNKVKEIYRSTRENQTGIKSLEFSEVCKHQNNLRMEHLGCYTGHKSYYLLGRLAELEQSLIQYAIDVLKEKGFRILSVPDILPKYVIHGCGMQTDGTRAQVYKIESGRCLSGTAEMAIAGFLSNKVLKESDLPLKYVAMSRCYRAETSSLNEEKGIYRVHQFTKVEMFSVCSQNMSEEMVEFFKDLETNIFKELNLNFRLLDMPPTELGASAYQKYDIEAWMPGKRMWGEISSCSNCTDYQSKRLNIKYITNDGNLVFAHTVNGTASAIPRLLISLIESNQIDGSTVKLPKTLEKYIRNSLVVKEKTIPETKLVKNMKQITNQN